MPNLLRLRLLARHAGLMIATCWLGLAYAASVQADAGEIARSSGTPASAVFDDSDAPGQTRFEPTRRGARSRFAAELRMAEAEHSAALAELRAQLAAAPRSERAGLQRRIEALKQVRTARTVSLQLDEARRAGRAPLAAKLERRLSKLAAAGVTAPVRAVGGER